jgi:hypothetical protein
MVREGAVRKDLAEIAKIKERDIDLRRLILVSDGIASLRNVRMLTTLFHKRQ